MRRRWLILCLFILAGVFGGCAKTVYRQVAEPNAQVLPLDREVRFALRRAFYADVPGCVVILPTTGHENRDLQQNLEQALARHIALKVPRVVTPGERRRLVRQHAVAIGSKTGRRHFAASTRCRHGAQVKLLDTSDTFIGIWSHKQLIVELRLFRISDETELWWAEHTVSRSDGHLPLSPVSLGVGLFKAASHSNDTDILMSMIDDAVRRMMVTLPTVR